MYGAVDEERLAVLVQQALGAQGAVIPAVQVQQVASIPKTAAGKTPLVKSNLPRLSPLDATTHAM